MNSHPVFVPVLRQPNLPHQIDLVWVHKRQDVMPVCACGQWDGSPYPPTESQSRFPMALEEYRAHVALAMADPAELVAALGG